MKPRRFVPNRRANHQRALLMDPYAILGMLGKGGWRLFCCGYNQAGGIRAVFQGVVSRHTLARYVPQYWFEQGLRAVWCAQRTG